MLRDITNRAIIGGWRFMIIGIFGRVMLVWVGYMPVDACELSIGIYGIGNMYVTPLLSSSA